MKHFQICIAAALLTLLGVGCGSDKTPESGKAACETYCNELGNSCVDAGVSLDTATCKSTMCDAMPATLPVGCNSATAAWFNCLAAQADVCATGCATQQALSLTLCFQ